MAMPLFRIYRMKDSPRQQFRWAPHVSGSASVKPKDYEQDGEIEAQNEYDAWQRTKESEKPLELGRRPGPLANSFFVALIPRRSNTIGLCRYFESIG